ncbi:uncharacterized protein LOC110465878 [Mizuhopecten yessoensis]|uniref:uncharacterized protein LOC110465878 n=1 Tax=Mizuhopecten yessoensis TaxID=6573 RepID=UPI000B45B8B9|nr:uncharacterized protein LOC110465878 [Mizuhopecten yessoensis]
MDTDDTFMDLSPVPSLDLGSLLNDYEPSNPQEGEEEISLQEEKDTGTQTKLGDSEVQKDTKHVYGQEIPHDQEPVAKLLQVNHPDPHVEINQLQGRKTQQAIQKGHCTGLKQTAALSKQEVKLQEEKTRLEEENEFEQKERMRLEKQLMRLGNDFENEKKKRKILQQKLNEREGESMLRSN